MLIDLPDRAAEAVRRRPATAPPPRAAPPVPEAPTSAAEAAAPRAAAEPADRATEPGGLAEQQQPAGAEGDEGTEEGEDARPDTGRWQLLIDGGEELRRPDYTGLNLSLKVWLMLEA